jgi:hypothetical protein
MLLARHERSTVPGLAPGQHLLGRQRERDALDRLLEAARGGHGGALVIHGEPGVGRTALLDSTQGAPQARRLSGVSVGGALRTRQHLLTT